MCEVTNEALQHYRDEAEATDDDALPDAERPGVQRSKILSVRLTEEEYHALHEYAEALQVSASSLVRGWIVQRLPASSDSPRQTVDRIAHEVEQLRRQITT